MKSRILSIFLSGLFTVLPIGLTLYVLVWFGTSSESVFAALYKSILPDSWYLPGMGLVAGLATIFAVGLLLQAWVVQKFLESLEQAMLRVPLVKTLYGGIRDFLNYFSQSKENQTNQAVLVDLPSLDAKVIGFITKDTLESLSQTLVGEQRIAVYMPMSYQIGGYTLMLKREQVTPLDMSFEEAMRFAVTAGLGKR